jgi:hypothetical protein
MLIKRIVRKQVVGVDWVYLAEDRDRWWALLNAAWTFWYRERGFIVYLGDYQLLKKHCAVEVCSGFSQVALITFGSWPDSNDGNQTFILHFEFSRTIVFFARKVLIALTLVLRSSLTKSSASTEKCDAPSELRITQRVTLGMRVQVCWESTVGA